jgi:hypothetical protein
MIFEGRTCGKSIPPRSPQTPLLTPCKGLGDGALALIANSLIMIILYPN